MTTSPQPSGKRDSKRRATHDRIADEVIAILTSNDQHRLSHDVLAERTGIARRTIYRYFPDRDSLLGAAWDRAAAIAGPMVRFPRDADDLVATIPGIYRGFDSIAPVMTFALMSVQGRQVRLATRERRVATYLAAMEDTVADLPAPDRRPAVAVLQLLHSMAWLEMRDQWGMTGDEIARACDWAIRTLLADLAKRGGKPLADGPA